MTSSTPLTLQTCSQLPLFLTPIRLPQKEPPVKVGDRRRTCRRELHAEQTGRPVSSSSGWPLISCICYTATSLRLVALVWGRNVFSYSWNREDVGRPCNEPADYHPALSRNRYDTQFSYTGLCTLGRNTSQLICGSFCGSVCWSFRRSVGGFVCFRDSRSEPKLTTWDPFPLQVGRATSMLDRGGQETGSRPISAGPSSANLGALAHSLKLHPRAAARLCFS